MKKLFLFHVGVVSINNLYAAPNNLYASPLYKNFNPTYLQTPRRPLATRNGTIALQTERNTFRVVPRAIGNALVSEADHFEEGDKLTYLKTVLYFCRFIEASQRERGLESVTLPAEFRVSAGMARSILKVMVKQSEVLSVFYKAAFKRYMREHNYSIDQCMNMIVSGENPTPYKLLCELYVRKNLDECFPAFWKDRLDHFVEAFKKAAKAGFPEVRSSPFFDESNDDLCEDDISPAEYDEHIVSVLVRLGYFDTSKQPDKKNVTDAFKTFLYNKPMFFKNIMRQIFAITPVSFWAVKKTKTLSNIFNDIAQLAENDLRKFMYMATGIYKSVAEDLVRVRNDEDLDDEDLEEDFVLDEDYDFYNLADLEEDIVTAYVPEYNERNNAVVIGFDCTNISNFQQDAARGETAPTDAEYKFIDWGGGQSKISAYLNEALVDPFIEFLKQQFDSDGASSDKQPVKRKRDGNEGEEPDLKQKKTDESGRGHSDEDAVTA